MPTLVYAVTRPELPPMPMSDRFRHEVTYFRSLPGEGNVPNLPPGEFWVSAASVERWLDDGVFYIVSPLDSARPAEIELSEEQEQWLEWMARNQVEHIRLT